MFVKCSKELVPTPACGSLDTSVTAAGSIHYICKLVRWLALTLRIAIYILEPAHIFITGFSHGFVLNESAC